MCLPGAELGAAEGVTSGPGSLFAGPHRISDSGRDLLDALAANT
ncbi:hypothetical protein ACIQVK_18515 [Streptomyces sp. NPDC090493]